MRAINLTELESLAKAATPGPWIARMLGGGKGRPNNYSLRQDGPDVSQWKNHLGDIVRHSGNAGNNARFIAAANPSIVLSLIVERKADKERIKNLEQENEELRADVNEHKSHRDRAEDQLETRDERIRDLEKDHGEMKGALEKLGIGSMLVPEIGYDVLRDFIKEREQIARSTLAVLRVK